MSKYAQEADRWFSRNRDILESRDPAKHPVVQTIAELKLEPKRILELGSSSGWVLNHLREKYGAECYGVDISKKAIEHGRTKFPDLHLEIADVSSLPFDDDSFDLVIAGYVWYAVERPKLFKIAYETDRVLRNHGHLLVYDYAGSTPARYSKRGVHLYLHDNLKMFTWSPHYHQIYHRTLNLDTSSKYKYLFTRTAIDLLYKNTEIDYLDLDKLKPRLT